MTGVQTCALPICFPVTIRQIVSDAGDMKHIVLSEEFVFKAGDKDELADKIESMILQRFELNIFRKKIVSNFDSRQSVQNIVSELFFND